MSGLAGSRWAPRSSSMPSVSYRGTNGQSTTTTQSRSGPGAIGSPTAELLRYTKIVRRLKWKFPYLAQGYNYATARVGVPDDVVAESELMFKLDFFEYYMLLERGLVHLLGVFGVVVSRDFSPSQQQPAGGSADHRYHANVLAALDADDSPLHETLGMGEVRRQLGRAKDLRNRWKNADGVLPEEQRRGKMAAPLETYDLEGILSAVFEGLDCAYLVAERFVLEGRPGENGCYTEAELDTRPDEEQWGFITDAMDWEAV